MSVPELVGSFAPSIFKWTTVSNNPDDLKKAYLKKYE